MLVLVVLWTSRCLWVRKQRVGPIRQQKGNTTHSGPGSL